MVEKIKPKLSTIISLLIGGIIILLLSLGCVLDWQLKIKLNVDYLINVLFHPISGVICIIFFTLLILFVFEYKTPGKLESIKNSLEEKKLMAVIKANIGQGEEVKEHPVKVDFSILLDQARGGTTSMTALIVRIDPYTTLNPLHSHRDIEEIIYVVEGEGAVWVDGEVCRIAKGDLVAFPPNSKHTTKNVKNESLQLLCFFSSPSYRKEGRYLTHEEIEF